MSISEQVLNNQHKNSLEFLSSIRNQLDSKALPNFKRVEGVKSSCKIQGNQSNWHILEAPDASVITESGLKLSVDPKTPTW